MFSVYFTHSIRRSFRGIRNSYVCKELLDTFCTIRDVFERDLVNGQTRLFDDIYRAMNSKVVKTLAADDSFNLSTIDFHSLFLFGSNCERCAEQYICQNYQLHFCGKALNRSCLHQLRFEDCPDLLGHKKSPMNLLRETMHTDETSCNVFSMTKYLTGMIVWKSLSTLKKSNRGISCSKQCDCQMLPCQSILESCAWFCTTQYNCLFWYKSTNNKC